MTAALLRAQSLAVGRGDRVLIRNFDLTLVAGEALHLKGPNGAGKTTLLETLAGLRPPFSGAVEIAAAGMHWLGHKNGLSLNLSATENLQYWCSLHQANAAGVATALEQLGLARARHRAVRTLSAGQKRRVALARLLIAPRPLWLFDEPLSGLDAEGLERFGNLLAAHLLGGGAAMVTSHQALPGTRSGLREWVLR